MVKLMRNLIKIIATFITLIIIIASIPFSVSAKDTFFDVATSILVKSNIECDAGFSSGSGTIQGGCTDGKYAYFIIHNGSTKLLKYELSTFKLVDKVTCSGFDHANDMTYNSKVNRIVIANNEPNFDTVTVVNPDKLEVTSTQKVDQDIYSIAYIKDSNEYVVGISGGYKFATLDANFNTINVFQGVSTGFTRQGCDCDDDYFYFSQSGGTNIIAIYNHSGCAEKLINVGQSAEIENIFHIGSNFYITLHHYGNFIYRVGLSNSKQITYNVNYDSNGGKGKMKASTVVYGENTKLSKCKFTKPGYTFAGWIVNREYDSSFLGTTVNSDKEDFISSKQINEYTYYGDETDVSQTTKIGDITLKAQWAKNEYTISYDSSVADEGNIKNDIVKFNEEYYTKDNVFKKEGHVFSHYIAYRDYDKKYLGYTKNCKSLKWLPKKNISKYYEIKQGEKLSKLSYDGIVTLIPQFITAYKINESKTTISKYIGNDKIVNIPSTEGLFTISQNAFSNAPMERINFKNNIQVISSDAFSGCTSLKEVYFDNYFPDEISNNSFRGCLSPTFYLTINNKDIFLGWYVDETSIPMIKTLALQILNTQ